MPDLVVNFVELGQWPIGHVETCSASDQTGPKFHQKPTLLDSPAGNPNKPGSYHRGLVPTFTCPCTAQGCGLNGAASAVQAFYEKLP